MREWAEFSIAEGEGGARGVVLSGPLVVASIGRLDAQLRAIEGPFTHIDLSGVGEVDTVGAWTVWRLARDSGANIVGASDKARRLIAAVQRSAPKDVPAAGRWTPSPEGLAAQTGKFVIGYGQGVKHFLGFLGELIVALATLARHPSRMRWTSVVRQFDLVGIRALPIIGLMSFLVGIVIAQQGAVQLEQFGAEIYTINLTGRLSFRELGVLMTAIMVAGRSGSSFAAQIGTMKLTEEIDAMRTIGVSPMEALVVPRVLASTFMLMVLGFYAAILSIIGGAFISMYSLEIPFWTFLSRIQEVVPNHDMWVGLIKGPVFGLIIALAGCYQGMRVEGNSEAVGIRTTVAVVQAIFAVIVLDAFFAVFFTEVGWG
ncbi:MAG: MlaE family lipid ABC transporter permease subunit [Novosphingobium sp.]